MSDKKRYGHWCRNAGWWVDRPDIDAFVADIESVCQQHQMSISHEDTQGDFVIHAFDQEYSDWLRDADVGDSLARPGGET